MKVNIAVEHMTKLYLDRVINSFTNDIRKFSDEDARDFIRKNSDDFLNVEHIESKLIFKAYSFKLRILLKLLIKFLLKKKEYSMNENDVFTEFKEYHKAWLEQIMSSDIKNYMDSNQLDIFKLLIEVVLEDEKVSSDEENILMRLANRFSFTEIEMHAVGYSVMKDFYIGIDHSLLNKLIKILTDSGVAYYLNKGMDDKKVLIPEEIAKIIATSYNYPLDKKSFELLFKTTSKESLQEVALAINMPKSGSKKDVIDRIWFQGYPASELLSYLDVESLRNIARSIENVKVGGTKNEVIENILEHFFNLETDPLNTPHKDDLNALWEYYELFAGRQYTKLRQLGLITKDLEIENHFEELTRYAFSQKLNCELVDFNGNNNPDGGIKDASNKSRVVLWDNKSQEEEYRFPNIHQKQFLQYVKKSNYTVSSFIIITGSLGDTKDLMKNCILFESQANTNVAIIDAAVFKSFVDKIEDDLISPDVLVQVFNHNGILDLNTLDQRYSIFA